MADFLVDPATGDLDLSSGDIQIVDGANAVAQHVRIRLRTLFGEWFLDRRIGVPYFQRILIKNPGTNVVNRILRQVVAETPGIVELREFTTEYEGVPRRLTVRFNAIADDGTNLTFEDELIVRV